MAKRKVGMENIRAALTCLAAGDSDRSAARKTGVSRTAVKHLRAQVLASGQSAADWLTLPDIQIGPLLYPVKPHEPGEREAAFEARLPNIVTTLGRRRQTLERQWELYRQEFPDGFAYSWFCQRVRAFQDEARVEISLEHPYGEAVFADFAGEKLHYFNGFGGERLAAEFYIAILPASQLISARAIPSQKTYDFLWACGEALRDFGGVAEVFVSDCLKAAVKSAHRYESEVSPQMQAFARYHATVAIPARPGHPKDKAMVENAVNNLYRWVLPRLYEREYYSLAELDAALRALVEEYNRRPMQRLKISRRDLFEAEERQVLKALPATPYQPKAFQAERSTSWGFHVWLSEDRHWYSVPHRLHRGKFSLQYTAKTVEIFMGCDRVATHLRDRKVNGFTTDAAHVPPRQEAMERWTPERMISWAQSVGGEVSEAVHYILENAEHPFLGVRSSLGLMSLAKKYGPLRLRGACRRSLSFGGVSMRRVEAILQQGLDNQSVTQMAFPKLPLHENIRPVDDQQEPT
ncbi:MAG: IS21 family transposase [Desulfovibrio sp.]|nr:IS21 family transposase [Desulfovibrio sp.]